MRQPLNKNERCGLLLLAIIIVLIVVGRNVLSEWADTAPAVELSEERMAEVRRFDSLVELRSADTLAAAAEVEVALFSFDPNTADSATLLRLGLPRWMVNNALKYRRAGGSWRKAADFRKLYGMTDDLFQRLLPYINIEQQQRAVVPKTVRDSVQRRWVEKFDSLVVLDLNAADNSLLQRVPGIGRHYAKAIVNYRQRLGGYRNVGQLGEIEGLPAEVQAWFCVAACDSVLRPSLNAADYRTLVRHPYINHQQARTIVTHVRKYGPLKAWSELLMYDAFTAADVERIRLYFEL
jgi:DNA uptake protein ComE-like DNA-binding protein